MDPDLVPLCDALNALPGVETVASYGCEEGEEDPWLVIFTCTSMESLAKIAEEAGEPWDISANWQRDTGFYFSFLGPTFTRGYATKLCIRLGHY